MTLAILFSLKTTHSLENGLQLHSEATPLFSMRIELLASSQRYRSIDVDAWCKRTLNAAELFTNTAQSHDKEDTIARLGFQKIDIILKHAAY